MESFIFTIFFILTIPFVLLGNGALWILGYEVTNDAQKIAALIVENQEDPQECFDIRFFSNVFGPTVASVQNTCVYEYASLTQDPSACELLMPGEYGFSCIGAAETRERTCTIAFNRIVEWGSYLNGTHQRATIDECRNGNITSAIGKKCCIVSKIANLRDFNDCSSLSGEKNIYEDCLTELALKLGNPVICDSIEEPGKTACILRAKYKAALSTLPPPLAR
ncbi:hypothetical protein AUJ46_05665 [Candidatus Peregrinibacteria bacterium CG1_02_54_53]|nr:MAG: hypothetical protein AUJ46_05665 [Candidatus Peregrinibacteria bacterium CG1_02_54_53]